VINKKYIGVLSRDDTNIKNCIRLQIFYLIFNFTTQHKNVSSL